jgi:hypothetical protein
VEWQGEDCIIRGMARYPIGCLGIYVRNGNCFSRDVLIYSRKQDICMKAIEAVYITGLKD